MLESPSITVDDVWLEYPIYGLGARSLKKAMIGWMTGGRVSYEATQRVQALKAINLHICDGDRIGVIGSNGAGKTTLLRVLAGALYPGRGRVHRVGVTSSLFDVYLGMNPEASGWDNIMLRGLFLGLSPAEIRSRTDEIATFSGLEQAQLYRPVRTYSSGMFLRLAFSVATSFNPQIILMDEWIWISDASFVERAHRRLENLIQKSRILVIATHADYLIEMLCNKAVYLDHGNLVASGPVRDMLALYHSQKADK